MGYNCNPECIDFEDLELGDGEEAIAAAATPSIEQQLIGLAPDILAKIVQATRGVGSGASTPAGIEAIYAQALQAGGSSLSPVQALGGVMNASPALATTMADALRLSNEMSAGAQVDKQRAIEDAIAPLRQSIDYAATQREATSEHNALVADMRFRDELTDRQNRILDKLDRVLARLETRTTISNRAIDLLGGRDFISRL